MVHRRISNALLPDSVIEYQQKSGSGLFTHLHPYTFHHHLHVWASNSRFLRVGKVQTIQNEAQDYKFVRFDMFFIAFCVRHSAVLDRTEPHVHTDAAFLSM